jgi:starvation-inducible DNA-binding protein
MITEDLNLFLSNLNVFYRKLQNYHWNIKGEDFFVIHEKLEELYNAINEQIDEIAEHILIIDGEPYGRMQDYLDTAQIQEASNEKICSSKIFAAILKDYNILIENATKIKEDADNLKKYDTSALMDEYLQDYKKKVWMIRQMLMK